MSFFPPRAGVVYADMTEELKMRQASGVTVAAPYERVFASYVAGAASSCLRLC